MNLIDNPLSLTDISLGLLLDMLDSALDRPQGFTTTVIRCTAALIEFSRETPLFI